MSSNRQYSSSRIKKELFRKAIHIFGFSIPFVSITAGVPVAILIIVSLAVTYSISEYFRLKGRNFPVFATITRMAMRDGEITGEEKQNTFVKAPLYFAAGILATLLIFPIPYNYAAITIVVLGDGAASVFGRLYGRNKIPYTRGKTIEGSVAGLAFAFVGAMIFVSPVTALIGAIAGMTIELLQLRITDNLTVPLLSGLVMSIIGNP